MSRSHALDGVPADLWVRVRVAGHRLLLLDYDGTIAPLSPERNETWPPAPTREWLGRLATTPGTTLAVVSGRPLAELERFLAGLEVGCWAEHGWEWRDADGARHSAPVDALVSHALEAAALRAAAWADPARLERKRTAVVLHTRALPEAVAREWGERCTREWAAFAGTGALRLDHVAGGLELRARARHKGTVVRELLTRSPAATFAVFVGDDTTDEDAFEALAGRGEGVRVGAAGTPTRANARLPDSRALPEFLARWWRESTGGRAHESRD